MKNLSFCRAFFNSLRLPEFLIYNISLFYCLLAIERGPLSLDCNIYIFKIKRRRKSAFMRDSCSRRLEQDIWWVSVTGAAKTKLVLWVPCTFVHPCTLVSTWKDRLMFCSLYRSREKNPYKVSIVFLVGSVRLIIVKRLLLSLSL